MAAFGGHDSCPNCGARMAQDQRYCLSCGHRRGDPRLPFMDAVVFMESMNAPGGGTPPPPPPKAGESSNRWNANAALIAGVATLVLAIGVGFLIGRSGNDNSSPSSAAPQVIKVEGGTGGGGEEGTAPEEEAAPESSSEGGKSEGGSSKSKSGEGKGKGTKETEENAATGSHGASKATEETLHPEGEVEFAEPEQELGGSCAKGTAGCSSSGKFEGNFFGE